MCSSDLRWSGATVWINKSARASASLGRMPDGVARRAGANRFSVGVVAMRIIDGFMRGNKISGLQFQFQQADLERERFLDVSQEQPLRPFDFFQIAHRIGMGEAFGDRGGFRRELRKAGCVASVS